MTGTATRVDLLEPEHDVPAADQRPPVPPRDSGPSPSEPPPRVNRFARWLVGRRPSGVVAVLAIATIGSLIALSTVSVTSSYSALSKSARNRLADVSTLVSTNLATQLLLSGVLTQTSYALRPNLVAALGTGDHTTFDKAAIAAVVTDLRMLEPTATSIIVTDAKGVNWGDGIPASNVGPNGKDYSSADWYQGVVRTGKAYVSTGFLSPGDKRPILIGIAAPIVGDGSKAPKGTRIGVLVTTIPLGDAQSLWSELQGEHQPTDLQVTDQKGYVLMSSLQKPTRLVRDTSDGVADALKGKYSVRRVDVGGKDSFAAYSTVPLIGWSLRASVPASVALSDANRLLVQVILITVLLVALIAIAKIILWVLLRDLQSTRVALADTNATLEARVASRTAELEKSNRELEDSNRELEAFSFSVSHDLRAPVRSIDGFTRMVLEDGGDELTEQSTRKLNKVLASTQQMGVLIDELLGFSRLSHVELRKQRIEPAEVVHDVMAELMEDYAERSVDFVVQALPACTADGPRLAQVFRNLLDNALKFTGPRPTAHIEVGSVPSEDPGMVTYFVKDDGVGFDMRYAGKLFEPFERLHGVGEFSGSGVGLALVRRIVERHGGRIWAESVVDSGATFYFTLEDGNA